MAATPPLVMQLIVDRELIKIVVQTRDRKDTQDYLSEANLAHMHKIVLQTPKNVSLTDLSSQLHAAESDPSMPPHYLWTEQPENVPTCLAMAPNRKPAVLTALLKKCTLLRS